MEISLQISVARKAKGLTQKRLGELIGTTGMRISDLESGRINPTVKTLQLLADALGGVFYIKALQSK